MTIKVQNPAYDLWAKDVKATLRTRALSQLLEVDATIGYKLMKSFVHLSNQYKDSNFSDVGLLLQIDSFA